MTVSGKKMKQVRRSSVWIIVGAYDYEGYTLPAAAFPSRRQAERYLKTYPDCCFGDDKYVECIPYITVLPMTAAPDLVKVWPEAMPSGWYQAFAKGIENGMALGFANKGCGTDVYKELRAYALRAHLSAPAEAPTLQADSCPPRQTPVPTGQGGIGGEVASLPPVGPSPPDPEVERLMKLANRLVERFPNNPGFLIGIDCVQSCEVAEAMRGIIGLCTKLAAVTAGLAMQREANTAASNWLSVAVANKEKAERALADAKLRTPGYIEQCAECGCMPSEFPGGCNPGVECPVRLVATRPQDARSE